MPTHLKLLLGKTVPGGSLLPASRSGIHIPPPGGDGVLPHDDVLGVGAYFMDMMWKSRRHLLAIVAAALPMDFALQCAAAAPEVDGIAAAAAQRGAGSSDAARLGIWKAATPPVGSMHGEFGGNDPVGLAAGARIPTDCSINWVDPDSHKLYCFSSATSLVYFLDSPHAFLQRALKNWTAKNASW